MSIYKGTQLISGVATPIEPTRNIGQIITSLLPLTDAGLHLLDGSIISGDGVYKAFVDYIKTLDLTASYFCTEAEWQTSIEQYGVCGKFVYDASANTVRLPKVTGHVEGTLDPNALGDLVEAGLPNIEGSLEVRHSSAGSTIALAKGCIKTIKGLNSTNSLDTTSSSTANDSFEIDASLSNPIYGNSDTVQTQSILGYMYIVLATGTKTDIEVDIDNVVTDLNGIVADLNGKADVSSMADIITDLGTTITSLAMPDFTNTIQITPPYTTPCDGWVVCVVEGTTNGYCGVNVLVNGVGYGIIANATAKSSYAGVIGPAPKGAVINKTVNSGTTIRYFIPCKGAN